MLTGPIQGSVLYFGPSLKMPPPSTNTDSAFPTRRHRLQHPALQYPSRTPSGCASNDSGLGPGLHKARSHGLSDPETGSLPDGGPLCSTLVQEYVNGLDRGEWRGE